MPTEISFEQKFGQLVDAQINEKLPSLVDYRVGFQVIDKDENETRAVGIAAFILNKVWLYIPVFFINGDLKGFELLYVKQKDLFVPAQDNWIATLGEQGVNTIGEGDDPNTNDTHNDYATPDGTNVYQSYSSLGKSASFDANDLIDDDGWVGMTRILDTNDYKAPSLSEGLSILGKEARETFVNTLLKNAEFANAMFQHYTPNEVEKIASECARLNCTQPSKAESDVTFITDIHSKEAAELEDKEKELLLNNGLYVKDSRTNLSEVYHDRIDTSVLQNPTEPGIYDVFMQNGEYKTMILLFPRCLDESPSIWKSRRSNAGVTGRNVILIDTSSPTKYCKCSASDLFVKPAVNINEKEIKAVQGGQKASLRSLRDMAEYTTVCFVQNPRNAIETRLITRKKSADGSMYVTVVNSAGNNGRAHSTLGCDDKELLVEFTDDGELHVQGNILYVPEGTRMFKKTDYRDEKKSWAFGKPETIYQHMHKNANLDRLEVYNEGGTVSVKSSKGLCANLTKVAAMQHLVAEHGIWAGSAQHLINEAQRSDGYKSYLIKHAAPYDTEVYGDSPVPFQGGPSGRREEAITSSLDTKGGDPLTGPKGADNTNLLPEQAVQQAMQAASTGIKEVFDVSVLSSLLDKSDVSELRKDYLSDMIKGMDKVGRMLFLYHWHNDEFEDRYGSEDMKKLEDTLKEVFISTGDLVLFLKEKTAYNPDSAESLFGSLSEDVAQA